MRFLRPKSYDVGPYIVRQDPSNGPWRVFSNSVALYHSDRLDVAMAYAQAKADDYEMIMELADNLRRTK